jgi:hypothetical protein
MLMGAYAYYVDGADIFPDWLYDEWYQRLKRLRYRITHRHLHLISTTGNGSSGAIFGDSSRDYPLIVAGAVSSWRERYGQ